MKQKVTYDRKQIHRLILENKCAICSRDNHDNLICEMGVKDGFYYFRTEDEYKLFATITEIMKYRELFENKV